jgi:hypothetical protein
MQGYYQSTFSILLRFHCLSFSNALDKSNGDFSDCSSIEFNHNDVTMSVVKRKASTPAKPSPFKKRRGVIMDQSNDAQDQNNLKAIEGKRTGKLKDAKLAHKMTYTVEGVLETWNDTSDYGICFRALTKEEQQSEVQVLNKSAAKGMKGLMKMKMLAGNYKKLLADKLREHLCGSRVAPATMFHCVPKTTNVRLENPSFISVGEWVEVDSDRSPGFNSKGGIAVVINVHDDFADVK